MRIQAAVANSTVAVGGGDRVIRCVAQSTVADAVESPLVLAHRAASMDDGGGQLVLQADLAGHRDTVFGNRRGAEGRAQDDVADPRTQRDPDGVRQAVDAGEDRLREASPWVICMDIDVLRKPEIWRRLRVVPEPNRTPLT
jgi:hypothetical protein